MDAMRLDALRSSLPAALDPILDGWVGSFASDKSERTKSRNAAETPAPPTAAQASHSRNKAGVRLPERGAEILYRFLDAGWGYNRIAKAMAQGALKHGKQAWARLGGVNRHRVGLDGEPS